MELKQPEAIIGTNSWGSKAYGTLLRGSGVDEATLRETMSCAINHDLKIFDVAKDYGFGKAQKLLGSFGSSNCIISAKFTPSTSYQPGQVRTSLIQDLNDIQRDYVDIYWLHLPSDLKENLREMAELYREGKIRLIGVSNFNLEECIQAAEILAEQEIPLYGVQNHYSLIARRWEQEGLVDWCHENDVSFWAWAVLEEGILTDPRVKTPSSIMKVLFQRKKTTLLPLYDLMRRIGEHHGLNIPEVAISYCSSKGIVPICGCRKPYQVEALVKAVHTTLSELELQQLEQEADRLQVTVLGADMFRFAVRKKGKE
ncbi:MAG: aldo/keto reductase [Solobacterium sp.]|nr:aldo/keto reductase [Solobacterium sp.]